MTDAHALTSESNPPGRLFGLMPVFASLSYEGGGNAITFALVRTIAIILFITLSLFTLLQSD